MAAIQHVAMVIEAVREKVELKREVFAQLDARQLGDEPTGWLRSDGE